MSFATIKKILTLKCEESTRLVSESLDQELPWGERWAVRLHAVSCRACRRYRRQLLFLREAARRRANEMVDALDSAGPTLSPEARDRIRRALGSQNSPEDSV